MVGLKLIPIVVLVFLDSSLIAEGLPFYGTRYM